MKTKFLYKKTLNCNFHSSLQKKVTFQPNLTIGDVILENLNKNYNIQKEIIIQKIYQIFISKHYTKYLPETINLFQFNNGSHNIPHINKKSKGGEDAYFHSNNLLVVADGVGGWNQYGIDPAAYSKKICELISNKFQKLTPEEITENRINKLISNSVNENKEVGSSTISVLYLKYEKANYLYYSYMGDSSFIVARLNRNNKYEKLFKSKDHSHRFNSPFQVGTSGDDPSTSIKGKIALLDKDIVILASDGLWDNLYDVQILKLLNNFVDNNKEYIIDTNKFSKILSEKAYENSFNKDYLSPFAKKSQLNNLNFNGGKQDDITIIVSQIICVCKSVELNEKENNEFNTSTLDETQINEYIN